MKCKVSLVVALKPLQIFEKRNGDWSQAPLNQNGIDGPGDSGSIDGPRVLFGGRLVVETTDSAVGSGTAGMVTYRAPAQFRNFRSVQP